MYAKGNEWLNQYIILCNIFVVYLEVDEINRLNKSNFIHERSAWLSRRWQRMTTTILLQLKANINYD